MKTPSNILGVSKPRIISFLKINTIPEKKIIANNAYTNHFMLSLQNANHILFLHLFVPDRYFIQPQAFIFRFLDILEFKA